jgi:hypothetical protein
MASRTVRFIGPKCALLTWFVAKRPDDFPGQQIFNLAVSWHGLLYTGIRIAIPIVLRAVANENAAEAFDLPN